MGQRLASSCCPSLLDRTKSLPPLAAVHWVSNDLEEARHHMRSDVVIGTVPTLSVLLAVDRVTPSEFFGD